MFTQTLQHIPHALRDGVKSSLKQLETLGYPFNIDIAEEIHASIATVFCISDFITQSCVRDTAMFVSLLRSGDLQHCYQSLHDMQQQLVLFLDNPENEQQLMRRLRQFRRREMVRIVWRDVMHWAELAEVLRDLSWLAESCIVLALQQCYEWKCVANGVPYDEHNQPQHLLIVGMGKLGAWELNVSSDIDLIFVYPADGETRNNHKPISNAEFFQQLGRDLIRVLDQNTADGFVFRVDMRLRPFGGSGPLAMSFSALEHYYQAHGREWERYAWIKGRVLTRDEKNANELMNMLKPFVYRRYTDYGAFESLRNMKQLITQQNNRKAMLHNIKLGAGGIREIEFITQVFQLLRGGREVELQQRPLMIILPLLAKHNLLPEYVVTQLLEAYIYLRQVENRLQAWTDQQTHQLPDDEISQLRLAFSMGYSSWTDFYQALSVQQRNVHQHFEQVFEAPQTEQCSYSNQHLQSLWINLLYESVVETGIEFDMLDILNTAGYKNAKEVLRRLKTLAESALVNALSQRGRQRLEQLMPLLLAAASQYDNSDQTILRLISVVEGISSRSVYLALLLENPMALSQLVKLNAASPWIAAYLAKHPLLLDDLIDARTLLSVADKQGLATEIERTVFAQQMFDLEHKMDSLRHFKQSNELRIAAADISQVLPLMQVSDHLSWLADVVLQAALDIAWQSMVEKHGRPQCVINHTICDRGFVIIAYGKLGGLELGYGSDLDLVFLHAAEQTSATTDGAQPLAIPVFYTRLGQRIIQLLSAQTAAGRAYQIDMRLRPNGASGFLVSSIDAYHDYQLNKAWIWEHQALVRARVVCGDPLIAQMFNNVRQQVLCLQRDRQQLRTEVVNMRVKMRQATHFKAQQFDLKQGHGGIADIEFMVQYGVLGWAHEFPQYLLDYTDNIRLLAQFSATGVLSEAETTILSDAYRTFRQCLHQCRLQGQAGNVPDTQYVALRAAVEKVWQTLLGSI